MGLAMVALAAAGYRARSSGHHVTVLEALPNALGEDLRPVSDYLDDCRELRHTLTYERVGLATHDDVTEVLETVEELRERVLAWLAQEHPELLPEAPREGT